MVIGLVAGPFQQHLAQWWYEQNRPTDLPTPLTEVPVDQISSSPASDSDTQPSRSTDSVPSKDLSSPITNLPDRQAGHRSSIPDSLNLAVPFTSQAPHANWDARHEEYCEEASALMVGRYFQGRSIGTIDEADAAMRELEQWQLEHLGYFESTTAAETKQMIEDVYHVSVSTVHEVTSESIKRALADGQLVILPAAGRELGNPYFQRPGPVYHMLVVKGYTADGQFITNDPGTRRGADFIYPADRLLDAVGDYNHGDPASGEQVMLVVGPR
ncbi:C39 family peptidase [Candidatus Berkelbacteria bacterium]|nr:C39 family peptidase [Candidatus Berkelbacteria bacterium]